MSADRLSLHKRVHLRYQGTDTALQVDLSDLDDMRAAFETTHKQRFGFIVEGRQLVAEAVSVEAVGTTEQVDDAELPAAEDTTAQPLQQVRAYMDGAWRDTPVFQREQLQPGQRIPGPAIICEPTATTVVEPEWQAELNGYGHLLLTRLRPKSHQAAIGTAADPVMLEVFNNLFMSVAEQMGATLANTAYSVNIKERLDFSCAIFAPDGSLVANAPHVPVHLGSMGESIKTVIKANQGTMRPGDAYVLNAPYNGGTHLPDVTVITPRV